ncbi:Histone deacetylase superfamily [Parasponia andersonii]|uniref:Histone deacetylase superfamily n=1 Tax=Parasponia andersonii TaxID=3476 RepID=A0A2P5BSP1_PARAD|nr:Histone deacetylase superfamily [Parasponia andersonii]
MAASASASTPPPTDSHLHVFWHEGMLAHDTGNGVFDTGFDPGFLDVLEKHPENSDRVKNMVSILRRGPISPYITWHSGRPALLSELLSFHSPESGIALRHFFNVQEYEHELVEADGEGEYIDELVEADKEGGKMVCGGTFLNPGSREAALLAAGTTLSAMKYVLDGHGKIAYALVRPPGHHAQPTLADGYCFFNNAGLAVHLALNSGCGKVAVIDIDVHYGNGTAEGFYRSDKVLTISLHMNHGSWGPSHPQNGSIDELGEGEGFGYNLNIPLPNGTGDCGYKYAFSGLVVPAVQKFEPDMIIMVIGQDSSAFDPNGRQCLTMEGYREIGRVVYNMANRHSGGRLLIVQEGGYHITYSAYCLHATLEGVLNLPLPLLSDPIAYYPEDEAFSVGVIEAIKKFQKDNVPFMK